MAVTSEKLLELAAAFEHSFHSGKLNPAAKGGELQLERLIGAVFLVGAAICKRLDSLCDQHGIPVELSDEPPAN